MKSRRGRGTKRHRKAARPAFSEKGKSEGQSAETGCWKGGKSTVSRGWGGGKNMLEPLAKKSGMSGDCANMAA